jgi:hypothetical protein
MATGGIELVSNDGQPVRYIPPPTSAGCAPVRWWSTTQVLADCGTNSLGSRPTPWLLPVNGGSSSQLFTGGIAGGAIVNKAWQLASGVYASSDQCVNVCLARLQPDGTTSSVALPGALFGPQSALLGASSDRLVVYDHGGNGQAGLLFSLNPETATPTTLLGGSVNGGSVNAALLDDPSVPVAAPDSTTPSPHFPTPEAAMTYLANAWNSNDQVALRHVTDPGARDALQAMHTEAVNLRLDHCTARPQGDYVCFFNHDYPAGTATTLQGGVGHAVFLVGPAATPGWYMTVFQGCG